VRNRRFAAEAALLGAALMYGLTFPIVHDALDDITPFAYLVGRFGLATIVLVPITIGAFRTAGPDRRMLVRAGMIAGVLMFGGYVTQTGGLQYTSPSSSAFITGLYVVITPVIESVVIRRLPRAPVLAGIVIATVGLYLLTGADVSLGKGELFTLACAVLFAFHIVYLGAYVNVLPTLPFTAMQIATVTLLALPPAGVQGVGTVTVTAVVAVVFTGVMCSVVALPLQLFGQRQINASRAALILLAEPVFAGIAGYVDGERLGAMRVTGAVVILIGIAVSELWPRSRSSGDARTLQA
jgi:drug/metabolite transporter (DMT)-like permease